MTNSRPHGTLRLRVFAGPNGSGKSTVIEDVRSETVSGRLIDFGYYINADDIAKSLLEKGFSFAPFAIDVRPREFSLLRLL